MKDKERFGAESIIRDLKQAGYQAYLVGGCVRDLLLHREVHDFDITTSATPEEILAVFQKKGDTCYKTGMQHGTITVRRNFNYEVTTFRRDGVYEDCRHPSTVSFSSSLRDDLERRDFTINALCIDIGTSTGCHIIDYFSGQEDLTNKVIRAVGDPYKRFQEDALRILRMLRFAVKLGFQIEEKTFDAAVAAAPLLRKISAERIKKEMDSILMGDPEQLSLYLDDRTVQILGVLFPEVEASHKLDQKTDWHQYPLWEHIVRAMLSIQKDSDLRWTMFFHDFGKLTRNQQKEDGRLSYHGHALVSSEIAQHYMEQYRFSKKESMRVGKLVELHDSYFSRKENQIRGRVLKYGLDTVLDLCKVQIADSMAQAPKGQEEIKTVEYVQQVVLSYQKNHFVFSRDGLAVDGYDLKQIGIPAGPQMKEMMEKLLLYVVYHQEENTKERLLKLAEKWKN